MTLSGNKVQPYDRTRKNIFAIHGIALMTTTCDRNCIQDFPVWGSSSLERQGYWCRESSVVERKRRKILRKLQLRPLSSVTAPQKDLCSSTTLWMSDFQKHSWAMYLLICLLLLFFLVPHLSFLSISEEQKSSHTSSTCK